MNWDLAYSRIQSLGRCLESRLLYSYGVSTCRSFCLPIVSQVNLAWFAEAAPDHRKHGLALPSSPPSVKCDPAEQNGCPPPLKKPNAVCRLYTNRKGPAAQSSGLVHLGWCTGAKGRDF